MSNGGPADPVKRAEEYLAGITPGEWFASENHLIGGYWVQTAEQKEKEVALADFISKEDADFIAAAPSLVRELRDEVKALREERDHRKLILDTVADEYGKALAELTSLRGVVEKVRKHCNQRIKELSPPMYSPINLVACALRTVLSLLPKVT